MLFGEIVSPMSLNQFAYGGMNPISMWDPTGMRPLCVSDNGCDNGWQAQNAWYNATQSTNGTMTSSSSYDPFVPAPEPPAPVFTYTRESYSVLDECFRRCGSVAGATIDWGTTSDAASDDAEAPDAGPPLLGPNGILTNAVFCVNGALEYGAYGVAVGGGVGALAAGPPGAGVGATIGGTGGALFGCVRGTLNLGP